MPKITFFTNIFPSTNEPYKGTFIKNSYLEFKSNGWHTNLISLKKEKSKLISYAKFYIKSAKELINLDGIAYIHYVSHSSVPAILIKIIKTDIKLVLHYHGSDAFPEASEGPLKRRIKRVICRAANKASTHIIAPTEEFKFRLISEYEIPENKISSNPSGGVNEEIFNESKRPFIKKPCITYASRMIKGKGAITAAQSITSLSHENPDIFFIGDGPEKESALNILNKSNIAYKTSGMISQCDLSQIFKRTDIFLFPSTRPGESLGLTWLEAVFCGAIPLIIRNGITEHLIPAKYHSDLVADDENDFCHKLSKLYLKRDEFPKIQSDLITTYRDKFSNKKSFIELSKLLKSL